MSASLTLPFMIYKYIWKKILNYNDYEINKSEFNIFLLLRDGKMQAWAKLYEILRTLNQSKHNL